MFNLNELIWAMTETDEDGWLDFMAYQPMLGI